jgi:hypothetical protein
VFDRRPIHVGFTVYQVALRGVYLFLRLLSLVAIKHPFSVLTFHWVHSWRCVVSHIDSALQWKFSVSPGLYSSFFPVALQPLIGHGVLIIEAWRSHSDTPLSVGLLCMNDQPDTETSTWQRSTRTTGRYSHIPAAFEPSVSATGRS